jgi:negative regulator of sigma E activity
MINCDEFSNQLSDYIDGELPRERVRLIDSHVASCSSCAKKLAKTNLLSDSLKHLKRVTATDQFEERLRARLQEEVVNQQRFGMDRTLFNIQSLPIKPIVSTFAVAAALAIAVISIDSYMNENNWSGQPTITPRIEIPPLPITVQPTVRQQLPDPGISNQNNFTAVSDSAASIFLNPDVAQSLPYDVLKSIRNQILQVAREKQR